MKIRNIDIQKSMEDFNVQGLSVSVIEDRQVISTQSFGILEKDTEKGVTNQTIFSACSISKFVTAMLVMKLTEEGIIDLDEDVNKSLFSWKVPDNQFTNRVTLRHLLSHQAGIIDPEDSFGEWKVKDGVPSMMEILGGTTPYCNLPIEVKYEPGSEFHYSDAGFCIIQQVIEDVMNTSFQQVMFQHLFKPLKMDNSRVDTKIPEQKLFSSGHNKKGQVVKPKYPIYPYPAASGVWTTSSDLSQVVLELMNALNGESKLGISKTLAKDMITGQGGKSWTGLGLFLEGAGNELEITSLGWGVGFQSMLFANPYIGTGAVIMTNTELGVHQMDGIIGDIYESLTS
ncbi:serine hydrolase domain-containing protein [Fredinandcohnia sp. 179-A 10B2 NHS]|uniref:serine hydrolase domain-containing protein n=1 Tax=Fredinandcohnia sp. 179-A 10B2 NHS TaxID=3235176 RepID=UPI00399FCEA3